MRFQPIGSQVTVEGRLLPGVEEDLVRLFADLSDPDVNTFLSQCSTKSVELLNQREAVKRGVKRSSESRLRELCNASYDHYNSFAGVFWGKIVGRNEPERDLSTSYLDHVVAPRLKKAISDRRASLPDQLQDFHVSEEVLLVDAFGGEDCDPMIRLVARAFRAGMFVVDVIPKKKQVAAYAPPDHPAWRWQDRGVADDPKSAMSANRTAWRANPALVDEAVFVGDAEERAAARAAVASAASPSEALRKWWGGLVTSTGGQAQLNALAEACVRCQVAPDGAAEIHFRYQDGSPAVVKAHPPYAGRLFRVGPGMRRFMRWHNGLDLDGEPIWHAFNGRRFGAIKLDDWYAIDEHDPLAGTQPWFPIEYDGDLYGVHPLEVQSDGNPRPIRISHELGTINPVQGSDLVEVLLTLLGNELGVRGEGVDE